MDPLKREILSTGAYPS